MSNRSRIGLVVVLATAGVLVLVATGQARPRGGALRPLATGRICGATRCVALPTALALQISRREESFSPVSQPKPTPYYRIDVTSHEKYGIRQVILWVPSLHVYRMTQYLSPPLPAYWRTAYAAIEPALARVASGLKPFPATSRWR